MFSISHIYGHGWPSEPRKYRNTPKTTTVTFFHVHSKTNSTLRPNHHPAQSTHTLVSTNVRVNQIKYLRRQDPEIMKRVHYSIAGKTNFHPSFLLSSSQSDVNTKGKNYPSPNEAYLILTDAFMSMICQ